MTENEQKQQIAETDAQILQMLELSDIKSKTTMLTMFKEILKSLKVFVKKRKL